jgi:hypothetical protein
MRVLLTIATAASVLATGFTAQASTRRHTKPSPVSIRVQLTETYQHTQATTHSSWGSTATVDEVEAATTAELAQNTILGGERVNAQSFSAQLASGLQKCSWTGSLVNGEAPEITIVKTAKGSYGMVGWPNRTGFAWRQALARGSAHGCPTQAQFSPLQGPAVSSAPSSRLSTAARFYSAVFPIPARHGRTATIPVSMSTSGAVPGQTDQTNATGTITISYAR